MLYLLLVFDECLHVPDGKCNANIWLLCTLLTPGDSRFLLTAAGDGKAILWNTMTGELLKAFPHTGSVRSVRWAEGGKMFATAEDAFSGKDTAKVNVYAFDPDNIEVGITLPSLIFVIIYLC